MESQRQLPSSSTDRDNRRLRLAVVFLLALGLTACGGGRAREAPPVATVARPPAAAVVPATPPTEPAQAAGTVAASDPTPTRTGVIGADPLRGPAGPMVAQEAIDPETLGMPEDHLAHEPSGPPDDEGFTHRDYLELLTPEEIDVLRARARWETRQHLAEHLTDRERANLRRRALERTEIGATSARIGE
jgi:hypothetical protein